MNIAATPHAPDRIGPEKVLVIVGHPDLGRSSFSAGLIPALKSGGGAHPWLGKRVDQHKIRCVF